MSDKNIFSIKLAKHNAPSIQGYKTNTKYVSYGANNDAPYVLQHFYENSAIHNTIINAKIKFLVGAGLNQEGNPNKYDTWDSLAFKLASDYELYNGFAIEIIRLNDGSHEAYHLPFGKCRTNAEKTSVFYASNGWVMDNGKKLYRPKYEELPYYDEESDQVKSVLYYTEYRVGQNIYPLPTYQGGLMAIETDIAITKSDLNNVKNGFSAGTIMNFNNGIPEETEKAEIEKQAKATMTGEDNTGQLFLAFNDSKDQEVSIVSMLPNNVHKQFAGASEASKAEIFVAHQVTNPTMYGVMTNNMFGQTADELLLAFEMFKGMYVEQRQRILESQLNIIGSLFGGITFEFEDKTLFKPKEEEVEIVEEEVELSKENQGLKFAEMIQAVGIPAKDFEIISSRSLKPNDFNEFNCIASEKLEHFKFADEYGLELEDYELLNAIEDNDDITLNDLAKATNKSLKEVAIQVGAMVVLGLIIKDGSSYTNSDEGSNVAKANPTPEFKLRVMYRYALRDDALPLKTHSRDFCVSLIGADMLYNKEDINAMSNESGTNVWLFKGGWYVEPDTTNAVAVPYCRHEWQQVVVKEK